MGRVFSVNLLLSGRKVVVVGDGPRSDEREARLATAGAEVCRIHPDDYRPELLRGAVVVMAHSDRDELDRRIASDARQVGALAYAHDLPEISDFAMPGLARRGPLTVAIATSGLAPALARQMRRELQRLLDGAGQAIDQLLERMTEVRAATAGQERRRRLAGLAGRLRFTGAISVAPEVDGSPGDRQDPDTQPR